MTAALDFAALPPEINSARIYTGAGSGPMLAAASAWNGLAAELRATAMSYHAVVSTLAGDEWFGPAAAAMAAAAMPYVAWMDTTAMLAEQTAAQAEAAAGAFEAAHAGTVAPALIAANRAQLAALVATNVLGQNTPAIAATEAQYLQMWAQDAVAMYGYAACSAAASELNPFAAPEQMTAVDGAADQQSALAQMISAVPTALQGLSGSAQPVGLSDIADLLLTGAGPAGLENVWGQWGPNSNVWNTVASTGLMLPGSTVAPFLGMLGGAAAADVSSGAAAAAGNALAGPLGSAGLGGLASTGVGNAGLVGKLSVPSAWTVTAPLTNPLQPALGGTPMIAPPPAGTAGVPAAPVANLPRQGFGRAVPQYGFRPSFVSRPPAAG